VLAALNNLVREADALYGSHHYNVYHFLLTLSDVAVERASNTASLQTTACARRDTRTTPTNFSKPN